jgi:hypothetical protein
MVGMFFGIHWGAIYPVVSELIFVIAAVIYLVLKVRSGRPR